MNAKIVFCVADSIDALRQSLLHEGIFYCLHAEHLSLVLEKTRGFRFADRVPLFSSWDSRRKAKVDALDSRYV
jgi:hypothetical protein